MVAHREGVIASSERQFATPHSPSSHSDRSLSWAYRDSSADLKPLQWITPDNASLNRSAQSAACVPPSSDALWKSTRWCGKHRGGSCGVKGIIYRMINRL